MLKFTTEIVFDWGCRCFGMSHMVSKRLRALRFAEEALELAQACDVPPEKLHALVDFIYQRPVGAAYQEVGGTMVTLLVLCRALGIDPQDALEVEVRRVLSKDPKDFAERNLSKIDNGFLA